MGSPRVYKARHLRDTGTFKPRTINLVRDRDQALHNAREWKKFTVRFLGLNPECYACGKKAQAVDHIRASRGDKGIFEKVGNHLPLCHSCHNTITAKFDARSSSEETLALKLNWLANKRMVSERIQDRKFPAVKVIPYEER